ncbi:MAG: protein-L-isoaspartate(D-aspartate) O-methyltransferase, partial [Flavitalea sp.]
MRILSFILFFIFLLSSFQEDHFKKRREELVLQSIQKRGVRDDAVLNAMKTVQRHLFVPANNVSNAYEDRPLSIGYGQTISQPYIVAYMTEAINPKRDHKVLEIGTGSGYQACILLEMGAKVYTIEYNRKLYEMTRAFLPKLGYRPYFFYGDGSKGLPAKAPFNKIVVTAGAPVIPSALTDQLAKDGILIIPVGDREKQVMVRIKKK